MEKGGKGWGGGGEVTSLGKGTHRTAKGHASLNLDFIQISRDGLDKGRGSVLLVFPVIIRGMVSRGAALGSSLRVSGQSVAPIHHRGTGQK